MSTPVLIITIAGTAYPVAARNTSRLRIDDLTLELEGYSQLAFHEKKFAPVRSFADGAAVSMTIDGTLAFSGAISEHQAAQAPTGWTHGYTALSNRWLADKVPITATDGTGTAYFNRTPDDDYYLPTDAGLSVGTIFTRVLTNVTTATALNALGIGGYTSLTPPTLPAALIADLALLTVVPPTPVILSGANIFNQLAQFLSRWHPKYALEVTPAGLIRISDTTSATRFVPRTITLCGPAGPADPCPWPKVSRSVRQCATRIVVVGGPNVTTAMLSLVDGTLAEGFSSTDKTNWTLKAFTQPSGATDYGTVSANTSNTATISSHDATFAFAVNAWSNNQAWITLSSTINTGIAVMEGRPVTANTALVAGGTATITWDASWPVTTSNYDHYRLVGSSGGLIDTWRLYYPREPHTGNTGLNTWVGAHLVPRSAKLVKWSNSTTSRSEYYTTASIIGGLGSKQMVPWNLYPAPSIGGFRFVYPTVKAFGQDSALNAGSPTTVAGGLPADVQILALFSLGPLTVTVPPDVSGVPQYQGLAYTQSGIQWTEYLNYPDWLFAGDTSSFTTLATEHLAALQDPVIEGEASWYVAGSTPSWAWMTFANSLNIAVNGGSSDWTSINATIRSIRFKPVASAEGMTHIISFGFSTRRKPFSGDELYAHPRFAEGQTLGLQDGSEGALFGGFLPSMQSFAEGIGSGPATSQPGDYSPGRANEAFGSGVPTAMGPGDLGIPMSVQATGVEMGGVVDAAMNTDDGSSRQAARYQAAHPSTQGPPAQAPEGDGE